LERHPLTKLFRKSPVTGDHKTNTNCIHCNQPAKQVKPGYRMAVCPKSADTWQRYKLTCIEYDWIRFSQAGECANPGCNNPAQHLDHNHTTGKVRQFLCAGCNKALGYLGEDYQRMAGLIQYLQEHEE
jgi:hypothetical protein